MKYKHIIPDDGYLHIESEDCDCKPSLIYKGNSIYEIKHNYTIKAFKEHSVKKY